MSLRNNLAVLLVLVAGCEDLGGLSDTETWSTAATAGTDSALQSFTVRYTFDDGLQDWLPLIAPVRADELTDQAISFGRGHLPAPLDEEDGTIRLAGLPSDGELFLGMVGRVDGLEPGMRYEVVMRVFVASALGPEADTAIPGGGPWLKIGALSAAPALEPDADGRLQTSFDRGEGREGAEGVVMVGDLRTPASPGAYELLTRMGVVEATADDAGSLWLVVGTEGAPPQGLVVHMARVDATLMALP